MLYTRYTACQKEQYMTESLDGALTPCFGNALICSPLEEIVEK